ncbi:nuclear receptor-binding factor 2 isoform X2 [Ursus maritimus]|uniref:Nuclear receptor-binding factor 2 isoform X2 n=1 Tax=Ursus maritimus TaxID=29073 RepID=A0A8M1FAG1_URSMA|nr:nuclear receptor-binding factor 2 isoform X2 [Ursus maritimus]
MEVMEGPLNLAHQQSRRADRLLAAGKYEEAISCHKKASAYLSEAMKLTQSEQGVNLRPPVLTEWPCVDVLWVSEAQPSLIPLWPAWTPCVCGGRDCCGWERPLAQPRPSCFEKRRGSVELPTQLGCRWGCSGRATPSSCCSSRRGGRGRSASSGSRPSAARTGRRPPSCRRRTGPPRTTPRAGAPFSRRSTALPPRSARPGCRACLTGTRTRCCSCCSGRASRPSRAPAARRPRMRRPSERSRPPRSPTWSGTCSSSWPRMKD